VSSPQTTMHTYTFDWTKDKVDWLIDGVIVRTLKYADAVGGENFPQTPMRLKLGNWIAGDPATNAKGTIEWAGGETDFSQAPFTMYVKSVSVTNYNPAGAYQWTDKTGSYESIKLVDGSSSGSVSSASGSSGSASKSVTQSALKSTAVVSNSLNTVAPTSAISVKKAQAQGSDAVVATSNFTLSASSTLSSVISSASAKVTSSAAAASTSAASKSSSSSSSASATSSQPAQQSTNAGVSNTVATGLFSAVGAAMAFLIL